MSAFARRAPALSFRWFAAHEARLMWRDWTALMRGGSLRKRAVTWTIVLLAVFGLHLFADYVVAKASLFGIRPDEGTLLLVMAGLSMMVSLMFSQAIEAVTRAYYGRSDLELVLSSPASAERLFLVRTGVVAGQTMLLALMISAPMVNMLAYHEGAAWLSTYVVLASLGAMATAFAIGIALGLLRLVGPTRTRLISQIIAAVVGAAFVIALQALAIMSGNGFSRTDFLTSAETVARVPEASSAWWAVAKAAMTGEGLLPLVGLALAALGIAAIVSARSFAVHVLSTAGLPETTATEKTFRGFDRRTDVRSALRAKEWRLLFRDPWLLSQSLQQILYLLPPALLLYMKYGDDRSILFVIVPVVIMAVGQLSGGLAWLAISGEDAHELITTAPVSRRDVLIAKMQAVGTIAVLVLMPFAIAMAFFSGEAALWTIFGGGAAAASAVVIQLWFRAQAKRSFFRRRQVSSRAATICEAMVAINWAAIACLAMVGTDLHRLSLPVVALVVTFLVAWAIKPAREA